jgi:hypothetical protein
MFEFNCCDIIITCVVIVDMGVQNNDVNNNGSSNNKFLVS